MAPPRKRDYAAEYARRQSLAKQRGHGSYYEQRIRGGSTAKPDAPRPSGSELRKARGHAGLRDLLREIQPESLIAVSTNLRNLETDDRGNWVEIPLTVYGPDGDEREYTLRDVSDDDLEWLLGELDDLDVDYSPDYDLRAIVP